MTVQPAPPLADRYDLVILDLDGVVYVGSQPVPGAVEAIDKLHAEGRRVAYATNNASRRADGVAQLLVSLGVVAAPDEVVTSAQVAAGLLAERLAPGSRILVVGADALRAEVADAGLTPVASADDDPAAVVQGYGPDVGWAELAEACLAVRAGARWVATNTDRTLPSPRGPLPGNGSLVAALGTALDRQPDEVAGKPGPLLFQRAAQRVGARRALVIGDRLDTDIEGALRAGMDAMLVLTGVSQPADLLAAPPYQRPTFVAHDLSALYTVDNAVRVPPEDNGWSVRRVADGLELSGAGAALDALRALCAAAWGGAPPSGVSAADQGARDALSALRIPAS